MTAIATKGQDATTSSMLECSLTSYAAARLSFAEANAMRKQSDALPGALGNSTLRHSDEQTLLSLIAVRDAMEKMDQASRQFDQWGVVCSSRYLGRSAFADALTKFATDGPWNVSVQVVPNRSLHSPASMVGLALGCHGPCVGVGGGLDGETDAWITALTLLDQQSLPGIWLVFSGWEPDEQVSVEGVPLNAANCTALALALQSPATGSGMATLRVFQDQSALDELEVPAKKTAMSQFESFAASGTGNAGLAMMLGGGLRAEMNWSSPATIPLPRPSSYDYKKAA